MQCIMGIETVIQFYTPTKYLHRNQHNDTMHHTVIDILSFKDEIKENLKIPWRIWDTRRLKVNWISLHLLQFIYQLNIP